MATEKLVVDNKLKTANSNIKIVQRKHEIPVKPYSGRLTRSMTSGVYVKKTSQRAGSGASRRQTQECVAKMLGLQSVPPSAPIATTSRDDAAMSMTKGAYVREVSQSRGSGASKPEIQRVGEILSLFKIVAVPTKSILDEEQATLIATSLQHDSLVDDDKPITSYEKTRLLNDRANHPVVECQCKAHTNLPSLEPSFAVSLQSIISFSAELGGDMKGGNLTNCGVELLKLICSFGGRKEIMVCPEGTSTAARAGSKVVYEIGIGEETICVEATPDFYARTFEYVYLLIGECESSGSKYPSVQLAIATLGQFASKRFKHPAKKLAACLFTKARTASVFLGEELGKRDKKIFVSFSKVNRECAFNLTSEGDVTNFADTVIGVIETVSS